MSGSLSGGCVEQDLIEELKINDTAVTIFRKIYGVNEQERSNYLLPCGGRLELLVEYCLPESIYVSHFTGIASSLLNRTSISRSVNLDSGLVSLRDAHSGSSKTICLSSDEKNLSHRFGPDYCLLILGVGDITDYLVSLAITAGFSVTVCDPREAFLQRYGSADYLASQQVELLTCLPDDLVRERFSDPCCAVVALAHDPRVDDLALIAALDSNAFFVGALGSRATCSKRLARLAALGLRPEQLARLQAPVGVSIKSKTPPEIAISIVAQLIEKRHSHRI